MGKDAGQDRPAPHEIRQHFDATLAQHMERLIGTSKGIGGLPLNLATISCLVLLAECESAIEVSPSNPPERHTRETFLKELAELGLDSHEDVQTALQETIEKEYVDVDANGRFFAKKPAISMAQLLDQAFPQIPGMNFVAYLIQTIDEVISGRKDLEPAISQFGQTLQMHGVLLSKQAPKRGVSGQDTSGKVTTAWEDKEKSTEATRQTLSEILRKRQTERKSQRTPVGEQPRLVTASGQLREFEVREVFPKGAESTETVEVPTEDEQLQGQEIPEVESLETGREESPLESAPAVEPQGPYDDSQALEEEGREIPPQPDADQQDLPEEAAHPDAVPEEMHSGQEMPLAPSKGQEPEKDFLTDTEPDQAEVASPYAETEEESEIERQKHDAVIEDDTIKQRIAAFEDDLAMTCPVCGTGRVREEQTGKGKHFYVCPNKGCIFISWGKPYHIVCPQCNNPFLIESTDRDGKTIFRCPRATCHHRQKPPWETSAAPPEGAVSSSREPSKKRVVFRKPRRKVVRRRRVRKKR